MFEDGRGIDYVKLAASSTFAEYKALTHALLDVDLSTLDEKQRLAFFISLIR